METWHDRLKKTVDASRRRAGEIAKKIGVSSATFSDWINGEIHNIEGHNLLRLCDELKISPKWLLFGDPDVVKSIESSLDERGREEWIEIGSTIAKHATKKNVQTQVAQ